MEENYYVFFIEVSGFLNDWIFKDYLCCLVYGIDVLCYCYIFKIVVWVKDEEEV